MYDCILSKPWGRFQKNVTWVNKVWYFYTMNTSWEGRKLLIWTTIWAFIKHAWSYKFITTENQSVAARGIVGAVVTLRGNRGYPCRGATVCRWRTGWWHEFVHGTHKAESVCKNWQSSNPACLWVSSVVISVCVWIGYPGAVRCYHWGEQGD